MNFSISLFQIHSILSDSSFLNHPRYYQNKFNFITKSYFSNFFNSFFFSNSEHLKLNLNFIKFNNYLNTVILINSFELQYETRNRNSIFDHSTVKITNCLFIDCSSFSDGGSIRYFYDYGEFFLEKTIFTKCSTTSNGGAIFFLGNFFSFKSCCFELCSAGNVGQAYSITTNLEIPNSINETLISLCSPDLFGRLQYTTLHQSGGSTYYNTNFSFGLCERGACSIGSFRTSITNIEFTQFLNSIGGSVIDIAFSLKPTEILKSNFINNTAHLSSVISYSYATQVIECYFSQNSKPITKQPSGRSHSITFIECLYDSFGIIDKKGIILNDCKHIEAEETTIPIDKSLIDVCIYGKNDPIFIWKDFSIIYIILLTFLIILTHYTFIYPEFYFNLYRSMFFENKNAKKRKRILPL